MLKFGGLWKHGNNQHALVPPRTERVAAQVAEELKTVTYATPPMEERRKKKEGGGGEKDRQTIIFRLGTKLNTQSMDDVNSNMCLTYTCVVC